MGNLRDGLLQLFFFLLALRQAASDNVLQFFQLHDQLGGQGFLIVTVIKIIIPVLTVPVPLISIPYHLISLSAYFFRKIHKSFAEIQIISDTQNAEKEQKHKRNPFDPACWQLRSKKHAACHGQKNMDSLQYAFKRIHPDSPFHHRSSSTHRYPIP